VSSAILSADTLFAIGIAPAMSTEQQGRVTAIWARETTAEVYVGRLIENASSLLELDRAIVFTVSPTRSFGVRGVRAQVRAPNDISWTGPISGEYGSVQLVLTEKGVTGTLQSFPGGGLPTTYQFESIGGGLQAIICVDEQKFPPDD